MTAPRVLGTYRLQLRPGFGFDEAAAVVPYLAELGVSHVYASPYLQAAPGSTHGYDVVDHAKVSDELGGAEAHARFCAALGEHGLGQVLDIVPNHMAITPENAWWTDVLENGPSSRYAGYFDVDWDPPESRLRNRVLLPVLGDHYGRVLEKGELIVERRPGVPGGDPRSSCALVVTYYDHWFPLSPVTYDDVLGRVEGDDELAFLARAFASLPHATDLDPSSRAARHRDKEILKAHLARADVAAVDRAIASLNADHEALDALLDRQVYRLAFWRAAKDELDYRRFFDITTLAGLRQEDELVFEDTHSLVLQWLVSGVLDGVRVDHPDGLRDPAQYVRWLRERAPGAWIVLEKILEPGERLPSWPADGTTGYDFLNQVHRLLVDPAGESVLTDAYAAFTGEPVDYAEIAHDKKRLVLRDVLAADLLRLTNLFVQVCESERRYRDFTRPELHAVLREAIACFPVYRTYVVPGEPVADVDRHHIDVALRAAAERRPETDPELWELLGRILRGEVGSADELCLRFQQTTGPVMAKGVEDTAFYTFNRFVALNEVGGDPGRWADDVATWHEEMTCALPRAMLASSTHDTKRSEDVRARLLVLASMAEEWVELVQRWSSIVDRHWSAPGGERGEGEADRNLEWLLHQVVVGAWPLSVERAVRYVEKATREAKVHTSWTSPDPAYDERVRRFVEGALGDGAYVAEVDAFVERIRPAGEQVALSMQALKLTAPGVPDIYQGTELWDLSLVDPDNRRPVDYDERRRLLRTGDHPKLALTTALLHLRRRRPEVFLDGAYEPVPASDDRAVAFLRGGKVAVVVPRFPLRPLDGCTVTIPAGVWTDVVTGATVEGGALAADRLMVLEAGG